MPTMIKAGLVATASTALLSVALVSPATANSEWSTLGTGMSFGGLSTSSDVQGMVLDSSGNVYAGGYFTEADGNAANYVAKWDGAAWSPLVSGGVNGLNSNVNALAWGSDDLLYVGGNFTFAGSASANRIATWDGSNWGTLGGGVDSGIFEMAFDGAGNLYVAGQFTTATNTDGSCASASPVVNRIAKWDGTCWSGLGTGIEVSGFGQINALAVQTDGVLYVGGTFVTAGGNAAANIAKWDGTSWSSLGSGMNNNVADLTVDSTGAVFAGGSFTQAGGVAANFVAKWDGSSWSPLGSGLGNGAIALVVDGDDTLYVGGQFSDAGGSPANNIARWDGSSWSALGAGVNNYVLGITVGSDSLLYVSGGFTTAGGVPANNVAIWSGASNGGGGTSTGATPVTAQFRFLLPDGTECASISPVTVRLGMNFTLPGVDANCRTMPGATVAGWTIPVPVGFTGAGSPELPFNPGHVVRVVDSQRFTVVPFEPVLELTFDANVATSDACTSSDVVNMTADGRSQLVWVPREDVGRAVFPAQAACVPPGYRLAGWNTAGDGSGTNYGLGAPLPADWAEASSNKHHMYAVWSR